MNEVKTMVQIPLDLLEKLIENNNLFLFQSRWMQGTTEKNAAEYASIEAVSVEVEKCIASQAQVMYHREFVPSDNYDGLLKQARALQSITKTQQASLAFARKDAYDLSLQLCHVSNDRLNSELEANQALTNEIERLQHERKRLMVIATKWVPNEHHDFQRILEIAKSRGE